MACQTCTISECINLYVSPCDTGIDTGIILDTSGDYTVRIEFNGAYNESTIEVVSGESIVLPNTLNSSYLHTLLIYDADGTLVNDTCYKLNMHMALGMGNNLTPNPPIGARKIITVDVDGDSFTNSFFADHEIISITTDGQSYVVGAAFTQSGSTITWINGNRFYDGQIILAQA